MYKITDVHKKISIFFINNCFKVNYINLIICLFIQCSIGIRANRILPIINLHSVNVIHPLRRFIYTWIFSVEVHVSNLGHGYRVIIGYETRCIQMMMKQTLTWPMTNNPLFFMSFTRSTLLRDLSSSRTNNNIWGLQYLTWSLRGSNNSRYLRT